MKNRGDLDKEVAFLGKHVADGKLRESLADRVISHLALVDSVGGKNISIGAGVIKSRNSVEYYWGAAPYHLMLCVEFGNLDSWLYCDNDKCELWQEYVREGAMSERVKQAIRQIAGVA